jgi:hypothetical protein
MTRDNKTCDVCGSYILHDRTKDGFCKTCGFPLFSYPDPKPMGTFAIGQSDYAKSLLLGEKQKELEHRVVRTFLNSASPLFALMKFHDLDTDEIF